MTPELHWKEVDRLLGELLELPAVERAGYLSRHPAAAAVKQRVHHLLNAAEHCGAFLETPALSLQAPAAQRLIGMRFGVWRLQSVIGAGGMGAVYLAERDDGHFQQRAAVKVLAAAAMSGSAALRFLEERQILARLEHPHVARLIDGGIHGDGSPYLVMEYVEGTAVDRWCSEKNLSVPARLELFRQIGAAVHFAHQNMVVHCDLKPANILVTGNGSVRLLDFGIARILDTRQDLTETARFRMTLDYASPEQVRGVPVTTASDIYSLGILLHELITGRRPYQLQGKPLDEVLDIVCRQTFRPSTGTADLDAIIAKALHPEPDQRYSSAAQMSADVLRYLEGRPVEARPPTAAYLLRRFVGRHVTAAAIVAALVSLLIVAGALVIAQSAIAARRFNSVRQLAHFMIFDVHDAVAPLAGSTPVRKQLVAEGLRYLDDLARDASPDLPLQLELASGYLRLGDVSGLGTEPNLGDAAGALRSYRKAIALLEPLHRQSPRRRDVEQLLTTAWRHTLRIQQTHDPAAALAIAEKLVHLAAQQPDPREEPAMASLAEAYSDRAGAEDVLGRASQAFEDGMASARLWEDLLARSPSDAARQRNAALAHKYTAGRLLAGHRDQDTAQVEAELQRAEELDRKRLTARPDDRQARLDLSFDLSQNGYFQWQQRHNRDRAKQYLEEALTIREGIARDDPQDAHLRERIAYLRFVLGTLALEAGKPAAALAHAEVALRLDRDLYTSDPSPVNTGRLAAVMRLLGSANRALGRLRAACETWEEGRALTMKTEAAPNSTILELRKEIAGDLTICTKCEQHNTK